MGCILVIQGFGFPEIAGSLLGGPHNEDNNLLGLGWGSLCMETTKS